jgi:hypothetical protein
MIEKLKQLIENSNLSKIERIKMTAFITKAAIEQESETETINLIGYVSEEKADCVLLKTEDFIIYSKRNDRSLENEYPIRSIYKDALGVWRRNPNVSDNFDKAMLKCLEMKHLGYNSQFAEFACKMLGVEN